MATQDNALRLTLLKSRMTISNLFAKYGSFSFKVFSAIGDQAFFSGSNFLINLLLARWMPSEEYGVVVVAFTWFLLVQIFYEALVVSPMSFYGADKYQNIFQRYLGYIFTAHIFLSLFIAISFGIAAVLVTQFNSVLLGEAMAGIAVASIFLLARGMIRQPFYILSKPQFSAVGGAVYLVVNILATVVLYQFDLLTPFSALVGMGAASFVTVVLQVYLLKPEFRGEHEGVSAKSIATDHWSYGKWALSAQSISWLATYFGTLLMPLVAGFSGSATLRATMNFIMPVIMMNTALVSLLTPMFVRTYKHQGAEGLSNKVRKARLMVMAFTGIYFLVLAVFGKELVSILYKGRYDDEVSTLYMMALGALPFVTTTSRIFDAALMSMGKIKLSFRSKVVPTTLTVILDLILVVPFGILGIAMESLITASMTQYNVYRYYKRKLQEDADEKQRQEQAHSQNITDVQGDINHD